MILGICLSNFLSIKDEVVPDMQAANLQTEQTKTLEGNTFVVGGEHLLKTVTIYGANASGESSIINGIRACVKMIFESHNYNENTVFNFTPFRFGGMNEPSRFSIRFLINRVEYEYSFSMTKSEIITKALYSYPKGRRSVVFVRDERKGPDKKDIYEFRPVIRRPLDMASNTSKRTLFISRVSQMDRDVAREVLRYFNERFILSYFDCSSFSIETLLSENKDLFLQVLRVADSDTVDIRIRHGVKSLTTAIFDPQSNQPLSRDDIQKQQLIITTFHKSNPAIPFDFFTGESDGTKVLFSMMLTVLNIVQGNKVLLIDETEVSLYAKLVKYIVNMFHQSESAQLVYTTHNTYLPDISKPRKDQMYFVNKRKDASSDLYSFFDFKDFHENMDSEKAYLQDRFDAIPYIDDSTSNLKQLGWYGT